jgi:hypothetical protein
MTLIRAFTAIAVSTLLATGSIAGSVALADTPKPSADKKADKPADKPADKKEMVSDADAQKFLAFFEKLVNIVVANQDDCVKMAAGINGHLDGNQAMIQAMNEAKNKNKDLPAAIKEKLEKKVKDEFVPALTKKCGTDKTVEAALGRMGGPKKK